MTENAPKRYSIKLQSFNLQGVRFSENVENTSLYSLWFCYPVQQPSTSSSSLLNSCNAMDLESLHCHDVWRIILINYHLNVCSRICYHVGNNLLLYELCGCTLVQVSKEIIPVTNAGYTILPPWEARTSNHRIRNCTICKTINKGGAAALANQSRESRPTVGSRKIWSVPVNNRETRTSFKSRRTWSAFSSDWSWNSICPFHHQLLAAAFGSFLCLLGSWGLSLGDSVADCRSFAFCHWRISCFCSVKSCI